MWSLLTGAFTHSQDGKPYLLSFEVGLAEEDSRSQGYTIVAKSMFKSMEDMKYYDFECPAHQNLKVDNTGLRIDDLLTVYYSPSVVI